MNREDKHRWNKAIDQTIFVIMAYVFFGAISIDSFFFTFTINYNLIVSVALSGMLCGLGGFILCALIFHKKEDIK